ncbi:MAG TPA: TatD family hydrolase, partial [Thermomicrobiales bacterium]|nr:TatD family hydrolase [Thermomicrobiales bacterium]
RQEVMRRAKAAGVGRIVNIGYSPATWQSTLALAQQWDTISFTLGMHPQHADEWSPDTRATLVSLLDEAPVVAVGEIGIDLYREGASIERQRCVFEEQLDLAEERKLPVVIHQRAAECEVLAILRGRGRALRCVFHSFEGSQELAEFGLDREYSFGVGGLMTRKSQQPIREILKEIPLEHILLETDAPYLVPAGTRDRRNEPANIPAIAERFAMLRGISVEQVAAATTRNATSLFRLPVASEAPFPVESPRR